MVIRQKRAQASRSGSQTGLWILVAVISVGTLLYGQSTSIKLVYWLHQQGGSVEIRGGNFSSNITGIGRLGYEATKALPPVHWHSSWIGNQWIPPPHYRLYSANELRNYFSQHSVLFLGDSTGRRSYATLYALLNASQGQDMLIPDIDSPGVIDVNKREVTEVCAKEGYHLCRPMPASLLPTSSNNTSSKSSSISTPSKQREYDLYQVTCLGDLVDLVKPESSRRKEWSQYSIIIITMGPWEVTGRFECGNGMLGRRSQTEQIFRGLVEVSEMYPSTKFVWRTWTSPGETHRSTKDALRSWKSAQAHNHFVKTLIHDYQRKQYQKNKAWTRLSYVDWGHVMGPRLFPFTQRIIGDIDEHHGLEARLAFVQMLINHLVEQDRREQLGLSPWWALGDKDENEAFDTANDCIGSGGIPAYCLTSKELAAGYDSFLTLAPPPPNLTPEEALAFEKAQADLCKDCIWATNIPCGFRLIFLLYAKKMPQPAAIFSVLEQPACSLSKAASNNNN